MFSVFSFLYGAFLLYFLSISHIYFRMDLEGNVLEREDNGEVFFIGDTGDNTVSSSSLFAVSF